METDTCTVGKRAVGFLFGISTLMLAANLMWVSFSIILLPAPVENMVPENKGLMEVVT
jgi:hypothetical protein